MKTRAKGADRHALARCLKYLNGQRDRYTTDGVDLRPGRPAMYTTPDTRKILVVTVSTPSTRRRARAL